jgi:plastocyanin
MTYGAKLPTGVVRVGTSRLRRGHVLLALMLAIGTATLGSGPRFPPAPVQAAGETTVNIPGDYFMPPAVMIDVGDRIVWSNKADEKHTVLTAPGSPEAFSLPTFPGKTASFKFTKPGIYVYYGDEDARYDPARRRVVSKSDADFYPIAMEGIVIVRGPGFAGTQQASINIQEGAFVPDVVVVQAGGKVTWTNADSSEHSVVLRTGGEPGQLPIPAGQSQTASFSKTGVYFFYSSRDADYNTKLTLAEAKNGSRTFPVAMQGYVVVP